jgi:prepilin-type N-terminal cleavage/methylation domain-containing protein
MTPYDKRRQAGLSLIETIVVVAIFGLIVPVILNFLWGSFNLNRRIEGAMLNQRKARQIIDIIKKELREAREGAGNQYPLVTCDANEIIYYADIDEDGATERVRYFMDGSIFKRGVIEPVNGVYTGQEQIRNIMNNVLNNAAQPVMRYYNSSYTGSGSPLSTPANCGEVRLVQIEFVIDAVLELQPGAFRVSSMIQFRNLKSNL